MLRKKYVEIKANITLNKNVTLALKSKNNSVNPPCKNENHKNRIKNSCNQIMMKTPH